MASSENSSQSGSRTRVIVGLDIGTTFSGISYAVLTQNPDRPTSFWWEVDGKKSQKIPTKIEVSEIPIEWFKLSLLHRDDLPSDVRNSPKFIKLNNTREAMNITAVNATADYISKIWNVFLTVPVVWPSNARQKMNEALHEARILNENVVLAPKFLAEPEAAALAFFSAAYYLQETQISKLQPGHVVIVCDCGGGTVDTGAYEVCSVRPFHVKEVLPGQCILAGACILDDAFMQLLKDKVETMTSPRAFQALTEKDLHGIVYNHWELDIKGCFNDNFPTKHIYLPIKWAASRHKRMPVGQGDDITFTHGDLASIFNPIVGKITSLIEMEMQKISSSLSKDVSVSEMPAKPVLSDAHSHEDHQHLIVAGGFGQNGYLRQKIVQTVNRVSPTTNILDYPDGQGIVRASWGVRASHGNSIFWLVHENESLDATSANLRPIPAEALSAEDPVSSDVFSIRVCRTQQQNAGQYHQDVCRLSWKTVDVGLKSDMNADLKAPLQIEFIWDGAEMGFSLIYGGVQQSSVKVEHSWEF
ncbi:hypothetical protein FOQG_04130 [Fusarium oxysporum f. sp. raphani 54005]|uniref:Actin-like ATPase domain-containing protein n=2 Tax=Fusarium oxysporum f. sp. raphani TaxID=96318 RepID=X0CXH4_FUSOX|nr:hypothetical protein FOQG_04130 [Fusarium oxysporum f. sp. raphani 54005]KAG7432233.1 hypothetical protein Forpi1262_v006841 [Fusarium oxysporum f. sp. raphani]